MLVRAKMRAALLGLLLLGLSSADALCSLKNGTTAHCHQLEDAKYIVTYDLRTLKAPVKEPRLNSDSLRNLSSLRKLDLSGGDLEDVEVGTFSKMSDLLTLNLADNSIEYLKLQSFEGLKHLQTLDLRRNLIRQLPPAVITLKALRLLEISGNPLDCNCAALRVRDLLLTRGVRISKKARCAGPLGLKGISFLKPESQLICMFEEQDDEMQGDAPNDVEEGSGELGSGDVAGKSEIDFDDENEDPMEEYEVPPSSNELETPVPTGLLEQNSDTPTSTVRSSSGVEGSIVSPVETAETSVKTSSRRTEDDGLFFVAEGTKDEAEEDERDSSSSSSSVPKSSLQKIDTTAAQFQDDLIIPVEGSGTGEEDDGSGIEGSGVPLTHWYPPETETKSQDRSNNVESTTSSDNLFDILFGAFWSSTAAPEDTAKELDLEEEEFINVTSEKTQSSVTDEGESVDEVPIVPRIFVPNLGSVTPKINVESSTETVPTKHSDAVNVGTVGPSKSGKMESGTKEEVADVSPARQSKKGMGSYVVLAALLAVLAALIGFAAYKGDFCRKKRRKRDDAERGTELRDMQKALLEGSNSTQPKISSNGNTESAPLVNAPSNQGWGEPRDTRPWQDDQTVTKQVDERPKTGGQESTDPVKPPRKSLPPQDEVSKDAALIGGKPQDPVLTLDPKFIQVSASPSSYPSTPPSSPITQGPDESPSSPGAQRVKITMQENPDSLPRTPILITRTKAGENLVKTP